MKCVVAYFNGSNIILDNNEAIRIAFDELLNNLNDISKEEIDEFKNGKFKKNISISKALNYVIDYNLNGAGYMVDVPINRHITSKKKWSIKYMRNGLLINICFKHNLNTTHELMKLDLAAKDNTNPDMVNHNMGILITLTDKLKNLGGFDNSVCTYELLVSEMDLYKEVFCQPLVIVALDEMENNKNYSKGEL